MGRECDSADMHLWDSAVRPTHSRRCRHGQLLLSVWCARSDGVNSFRSVVFDSVRPVASLPRYDANEFIPNDWSAPPQADTLSIISNAVPAFSGRMMVKGMPLPTARFCGALYVSLDFLAPASALAVQTELVI